MPATSSVSDPSAQPAAPRLARHSFTLSDGHRVGLAVSGHGVPLVVVHGFTAEGFLYAQTLRRLVAKGFKVVAIDMAGHGGTQGLLTGGARLGDYAELMSRCIEELGIRRGVLAGHSMGGRVVAQLAATHPEQAVAVLLIDAIVGDEWDRMVRVMRFSPPLLGALGAALVADALATLPVFADPAQAAKLGRLLVPTAVGHVLQPWRLFGPGVSILRSKGSHRVLDELAAREVPTFVVHGDRDMVVPVCTARSAARRANAELVVVHGAAHSWLLRDPETLPAVVVELLGGRLGDAIRAELPAAGAGDVEALERVFYEPGAPILHLTPAGVHLPEGLPGTEPALAAESRPPRYRWTVH